MTHMSPYGKTRFHYEATLAARLSPTVRAIQRGYLMTAITEKWGLSKNWDLSKDDVDGK